MCSVFICAFFSFYETGIWLIGMGISLHISFIFIQLLDENKIGLKYYLRKISDCLNCALRYSWLEETSRKEEAKSLK